MELWPRELLFFFFPSYLLVLGLLDLPSFLCFLSDQALPASSPLLPSSPFPYTHTWFFKKNFLKYLNAYGKAMVPLQKYFTAFCKRKTVMMILCRKNNIGILLHTGTNALAAKQ